MLPSNRPFPSALHSLNRTISAYTMDIFFLRSDLFYFLKCWFGSQRHNDLLPAMAARCFSTKKESWRSCTAGNTDQGDLCHTTPHQKTRTIPLMTGLASPTHNRHTAICRTIPAGLLYLKKNVPAKLKENNFQNFIHTCLQQSTRWNPSCRKQAKCHLSIRLFTSRGHVIDGKRLSAL